MARWMFAAVMMLLNAGCSSMVDEPPGREHGSGGLVPIAGAAGAQAGETTAGTADTIVPDPARGGSQATGVASGGLRASTGGTPSFGGARTYTGGARTVGVGGTSAMGGAGMTGGESTGGSMLVACTPETAQLDCEDARIRECAAIWSDGFGAGAAACDAACLSASWGSCIETGLAGCRAACADSTACRNACIAARSQAFVAETAAAKRGAGGNTVG